uniref:soluble lamin-associated protein of 75 kDa isoform X2 n=1 Tax=Myxine glutinosa TaxID=7769 RepID=UPI00358FA990
MQSEVKGGDMLYPVDLLSSLSFNDLEEEAIEYQQSLLFDNPSKPTTLNLNKGHTIPISSGTTSFVPLFGNCTERKVLALFTPDEYTASAIYLGKKWWTVEDILRTSDDSRKGLVPVKSMGEHIVLYVLNRIMYRTREMEPGGRPFLLHGSEDSASVMWLDGEAVGFYTVKATDTLCTGFVNQCYELHVLYSIYVRRAWRRRGFALRMLEDYVDKFDDERLGIKFPLSAAMYHVCKKHLEMHPGDRDVLWEVIMRQGKLFHHENIWECLQQTWKKKLAFRSCEADICFPEGIQVTMLPRPAIKCTAKKPSMQVACGPIASTPQKPPVIAPLCGGGEDIPGPSSRLGHKAEIHMDDSADCTDRPLDGHPSSSSAKRRKGHSEEASVQEDLVNGKTVAHLADNGGAETHCETLLEKQNGSSPPAQMSLHAVDISGKMSLKLSNVSSTASNGR